jgi:uncharacterized protein DUF4307
MSVVREDLPPHARYGRSADQRADRTLKIVGAVLGIIVLAAIGWYGYHSIAGGSVSGQIIKYQPVSSTEIQIHLEVNKGKHKTGDCTVRALDTDHNEVGRKDVPIDQARTQVDEIVTLRTTGPATATELVGCSTR